MPLRRIRIGSLDNIQQYDDVDFSSAIETDQPMKAGTPVDPTDVLRLVDVGVLIGDVVGPAGATTNDLAAFDGATGKKLKDSGLTTANVSDAIAKKHTAGADTSLGIVANPIFTGNVKGTTAGGDFAAINPTNAGINYVGSKSTVILLNNQTITFTANEAGFAFTVSISSGFGALFFAEYYSATITKLSDPSSAFVTIDTNTGNVAVFKSATSLTVSIKNYTGALLAVTVTVLGNVASATAPA